ncbi:hypothetical protein [Peterkaempfera bronchialis]|uniref:hypothetical protein n=1 Tax=Peterkaempfera bronchialis TaxID=2126346 RepID=UPI003C2AB3A0
MGHRLRPCAIAGCGNHVVTVMHDACGRGDVLKTAFPSVLFTGTGQQRGQSIVVAWHLLDSGASMHGPKVSPVKIEERRRPQYIKDGQYLTQAIRVDEILRGQLPCGTRHQLGDLIARHSDDAGVTEEHDPRPQRRTQP